MERTQVEQKPATKQATPGMEPRLVWTLAVACALTVANLYYIQPLLVDIAHGFNVSDGTVGFIATLTQLGYAAGLLFLVPLGDFINRRDLISFTLFAVTAALAATALAPSILVLAIASFAVGVTTIGPQIIVPFAATLAPPRERGRIIGTIMSGLLIGVLLARVISGFIGAQFGWRSMYWIAAMLMFVLAFALRAMLPGEPKRERIRYPQLLRSLWQLVCTEPVLRETSAFGGLVFGAFSVFWVTLVFFLATPPYHYGSEVAGAFGLAGIAGALAASVVGKLSDRIPARNITGIMIGLTLLSFLLFWLTGHWLWGLILGVILLDLGTQGTHISNQARIYSLNPAARSRLNTVYMVTYFTGGSLGSILGAYAWTLARWNGVCAIGAILLLLALAIYGLGSREKN